MTKLTYALVVVAFAFATPAVAELTRGECNIIGETAKSLMRARQAGVGLAETLEFLESPSAKPVEPIMRPLVMQAYETPRWNAPDRVEREIQDFADKALLDCLKAIEN